MGCHVCGAEAVDRCYSCGRLFCEKHGATNCVVCQNAIVEGDPSPERVTAKRSQTAQAAAWWRPQPAEEYSPPACYICQGLTRSICVTCGRYYCGDHAGKRRNCEQCKENSNASLFLVGGFLFVMVVFVLIAAWLG